MMPHNERKTALHILHRLYESHTSLTQLLHAEPHLTSFTQELCYGVCRHYFRLQAMAGCLYTRPPKDLTVQLVIFLGLYQLYYLQYPDYAVVKETVALLDKPHLTWAKSFVNAILRRYCREKEQIFNSVAQNSSFIQGHPDWLVKRLKKAWPAYWQNILAENDQHPPMHLRVNALKSTRENYLEQLLQAGIAARKHPYAAHGITLSHPYPIKNLPGFVEGHVAVQDIAAQLAVTLLDLKPGQRLLDACAAPGGKTCHILETEPRLANCVALDLDASRLKRVEENLSRLHHQATLLEGDAATPETWWDGKLFDRILLDAPCSATGVIRRHPDIKLLRTPQAIEAIVQIQSQLLQALWPLLAPNGILVYATCSILPEENEQQIARFVTQTPDCIHVKTQPSWGQNTGHGQQILPGEEQMDGFFYSVLQKN